MQQLIEKNQARLRLLSQKQHLFVCAKGIANQSSGRDLKLTKPPLPLVCGKAHEILGSGAKTMAAMLLGQGNGRIMWATSSKAVLYPDGVANFFDPYRLLLLRGVTEQELLWSAEQALLSGAVKFVVIEIDRPLEFKLSIRLQLAAQKTNSTLLVLNGAARNSSRLFENSSKLPTAFSRWICYRNNTVTSSKIPRRSAFVESRTESWHLELTKNKGGNLGAWDVRWDEHISVCDFEHGLQQEKTRA